MMFLLVKTIFFHWHRYFWRSISSRIVETHFSVQKKKHCFLFRAFFPASGIHYLNYREAYLKLLLLLLTIILFDFVYIPVNVTSFSTNSSMNFPFLLMGTNFLSIWNNILLLRDFFLLVETIREMQLWKITLFLLVETDFLASANHSFLPFIDSPATDIFIFLSSRNVFFNEYCNAISGNEFSGQ